MTLVEMREWMLTQGADLTKMEQVWVEQTRKLVSVMPPLPPPPKSLTTAHSSTSMPLNQEVQNLPSMSTPSSASHLPSLHDLIHQIFPMDQLPTHSFVSPYQGVMKPPFVATLMVPPSDPMKLGIVTEPSIPSLHRTSHLGSYEIRDLASSRSPSPALTESPNMPTTSKLS